MINDTLKELYIKYDSICEKNMLTYQPDGFITHILEYYITHGENKLPHPLYATWDITNYCNLSCVFCSASALGKKGFVDSPVSLTIADKIIEIGIKYVSIRGGEPMLVKQLPEIINKLISNNIFVEVVSNGTNFNDRFFTSLGDVNKDMLRIKISLDSTKEEINDSLRGKGSHNMASNAIKYLGKHDWNYRVQMVLTNKNLHDIEDMYDFVNDNKAKSFGIYLVLPMGRGKDVDRVIIDESLLTRLISLKENEKHTVIEKLGMGIDGYKFSECLGKDISVSDFESEMFSMLKCNGCRSRINVDSNGDIYPCDMMKYEECYLGNIMTDSFNTIWNSTNAKIFRTLTRKNKDGCKDCKIKICNTGCYGISYGIYRGEKEIIPNCKL